MTPVERIIDALLRLYPTAWRQEYGAEVADVLSQRPLSLRILGDLLRSAVWQRLRDSEPALRIGMAAMMIVLTGVIWNVMVPSSAGHGLAAVLQDSSKTLPTVVVTPLASDLFILAIIACGCWTHLRYGTSVSRCGVAALRLCAIAGMPIMIVGLLMASKILPLRVVGPADAATILSEVGPMYTYHTTHAHAPSALTVLTAPLFRLPEAWVWGMVGGALGCAIAGYRRRRAAASSFESSESMP